MDERELTEEEFLATYDASRWPHPALTADIAVFRQVNGKNQLLMVKRGNHPYRGCWALPGGFFEPGETIEQTAARELYEEVGIEGVVLEPFGVYSTPGRDPRDWVVTVAFLVKVDEGIVPHAGDDAAATCWFDIERTTLDNGTIQLQLSADTVKLCTQFTVEQGPITGMYKTQVVAHEGFAFDHYAIVADAWTNCFFQN